MQRDAASGATHRSLVVHGPKGKDRARREAPSLGRPAQRGNWGQACMLRMAASWLVRHPQHCYTMLLHLFELYGGLTAAAAHVRPCAGHTALRATGHRVKQRCIHLARSTDSFMSSSTTSTKPCWGVGGGR